MMYKLLCTDMDGTLLGKKHEISKENIEAVKKASAKGVKIAVCTGRLHSSAFYYASLLEVKTPVISSNGAFIREKDEDKIIYKSILKKEHCNKILNVCRKYGLNVTFHTPNTVFAENELFSAKNYQEFNKNLPEEGRVNIEVVPEGTLEEIFDKYEEDIIKAIVIEDEKLIELKKAKDEVKNLGGLEVVSSFPNNFEIMSEGVSKGRAVEIIANTYGIKKEEVICIGDNENDISMLKYAGLGIAMGNASEEAKGAADYITDTNLNNGVAKAIEKFILNED
ncbi:Cof-type HAD-IIB family hydrolase [Clostridium sp.]|uniref:Cof-type HAD-IIB family hydrolase n=1 Tax=Clostridium sp. TaxID=1506 RepID=UPI003463A181